MNALTLLFRTPAQFGFGECAVVHATAAKEGSGESAFVAWKPRQFLTVGEAAQRTASPLSAGSPPTTRLPTTNNLLFL
ncbi:MAG: hypothetical protein ACHBN1_08220 [Heteroscytonema crispum UTEX LB 1556]